MRDNIEFRTKQWRTELSISVVCNDRRFGYPPSMLSIWLDIRFLFSLRNKWRLSDLLLGKSPNCHQFRIILGEFLAFLHPFLLNYIITHNILILDVIEAIFLWNDVAIPLAHAIKIEKKPEWCIFLQCACKSWAVRQIYIFFSWRSSTTFKLCHLQMWMGYCTCISLFFFSLPLEAEIAMNFASIVYICIWISHSLLSSPPKSHLTSPPRCLCRTNGALYTSVLYTRI